MTEKRKKISTWEKDWLKGETENERGEYKKSIVIVEHDEARGEGVMLIVPEDEIDSTIMTLLSNLATQQGWPLLVSTPFFIHIPTRELLDWMRDEDRKKYDVKKGMKFCFLVTKMIHINTADQV